MEYAPVIIPTLCRYEHFKVCLESLARCTGSDQTEVIIGLDYPKDETHVEGHRKIEEYLSNFSGFKKIHVIKHKTNQGVLQNVKDLRERAKKISDRYIYSEDDNEFSQNFLEYINQGLEKFKDDPSVISINGYSYPHKKNDPREKYPYNAYPYQRFQAWGYGSWFYKMEDVLTEMLSSEKAWNFLHSWKKVRVMYKKHFHRTIHRLLFRYKNAFGDLMWTCYCVTRNKYCIVPKISKVRNHGFDGSGLNCVNLSSSFDTQPIDTECTFSLDDFEIKEYPEIKALHETMFGGTWKMRRISELEYVFFRLTGVPLSRVSLGKKISSILQKLNVKYIKI